MRGDIFGRVAAPLAAVAAAIFAFGVTFSAAQAEDAKPADTKPATTPAPAATTTPATPKTTDTKTTDTKAAAAATPSPCKGLDETACKANTACSWHKEGKSKTGAVTKAHCQKKSTPKKKTTTPTAPQ
jgi:hypothetical protein